MRHPVWRNVSLISSSAFRLAVQLVSVITLTVSVIVVTVVCFADTYTDLDRVRYIAARSQLAL